MKTWIIWSSMLLTMMWSACSSGQGEKALGVIHVSSAFENLTELKVSQLGKTVRYVPLETTDESLIGATAALHLLKDKVLVVTEGNACHSTRQRENTWATSVIQAMTLKDTRMPPAM